MRILSIDCSTKSAAYAIHEDEKLIKYGEYYFEGVNFYKRLRDAKRKTEALLPEFEGVDYIAFEQAIRVMSNSVNTALSMAKVFGAIMAVLGETDATVFEVPPTSWQSYIGNVRIIGEVKRQFLVENPQFKTKSQQTKGIYEHRKKVTIKWVKKNYGVDVTTNNQSDAIALGAYAHNKLKEIQNG